MKQHHDMIADWFADNSDITQIIAGIFDYNGILRAKRLPVSKLNGILSSGLKMPHSIQLLDIFGHDIEGHEMVFATGDKDISAVITGRLPVRLPFCTEPTALLMLYFDAAQSPHNILTERHNKADNAKPHLTCGIEMEFTLITENATQPAASLATGKPPVGGNILSALQLDDYDVLLAAIKDICDEQDIKIDTITSEAGFGQFEITFMPKTDLAILAEDILVFKYLVKGLAKQHGITASFMAKPFQGQPGNGMHIHASLIDHETGTNLFDEDASNSGKDRLHYAVGGLLSSLRDASLLMAPMMNSYRRLVPSSHAPVNICWGYDNRTAALRIPDSPPAGRRIEMRVPGADANPYMILAYMACQINKGIQHQMTPPAAITGNAYEQNHQTLAADMASALVLMAESKPLHDIFGSELAREYVRTKRQEYQCFLAHIPPFEFATLSEQL